MIALFCLFLISHFGQFKVAISQKSTRELVAETHNHTSLIATSILEPPFLMLQEHHETLQGNDRYRGYIVDLIKLLRKNIGSPIHIRLVADDKYGRRGANGKWTGMVGELLRGEADLIAAPLTMTQARSRVIDFSAPFMTTGISVMIKKPPRQELSPFIMLQVFPCRVWFVVGGAYLLVSVLTFLLGRFIPDKRTDYSLLNCFWFTISGFLFQGPHFNPRSVAIRIVSVVWWVFSMLMLTCFLVGFTRMLTVEKLSYPINSVEDLAAQTKIKYGTIEGGSTASFFKNSKLQLYRQMWAFMEAQTPSVFASSVAEGVNRVRTSEGRYVFLLESYANDFYNHRRPCDTKRVGELVNLVEFGIATPRGSPYRKPIQLAILELRESGKLKELEDKWWYRASECPSSDTDDETEEDQNDAILKLSNMWGILYLLGAGLVVALVVGLVEFVVWKVCLSRRNSDGANAMKVNAHLPSTPMLVYHQDSLPENRKRLPEEDPMLR